MEFKFDPNQEYQLDAISAITDLFEGQPRQQISPHFALGQSPAIPNQLNLSPADLLENLQAVQRRHFGQPDAAADPYRPDSELRLLEAEFEGPEGRETARFPNFSVEMETGTGKTYVYLRTALELFERFGFRKFIIVVHSVAVREGVIKTLRITRKHFRGLYDNLPYRFTEYSSDNLAQVRQFALSDSVEFLVMTLDSFNKTDINVIHRATDRLQGGVPIHLVQAARPILILDEPQNMESEKSIAALAALNPLLALRYSATHRVPYNVVYRLTPAEAYRLNLVKRIEVNGIERLDENSRPFIRLKSVETKKQTLSARLVISKQLSSGRIADKPVTVKPGDSLEQKSGGREVYAPYRIDEINIDHQMVRFSNTELLQVGEEMGGDRTEIFRGQIQATIEEHLRKQALYRAAGVKVISLFFIDRVDNYAPRRGTGIIRQIFDETFNRLKQNNPDWEDKDPAEVQAGYFAQRTNRTGETIYLESKTGTAQTDQDAYELIMRDKERLLSFEEPVAFIFSHSALREGWDNPNIFQICTLNQAISETRRRQEVGRGVRLAVNQAGDRLTDEKLNILTVVASGSYKTFVQKYQQEINEEYYDEIAHRFGKSPDKLTAEERRLVEAELGKILPPPPADARRRVNPKLRKQYQLSPEFKTLWAQISRRTRYNVTVDSEKLIEEVAAGLKLVEIKPPRIVSTKARVTTDPESGFQALQMSAAKTLTSLAGRFPLPNLVEVMAKLMEHTSPPMRLTRRTLLEIIRRAPDQQAIVENPHEFAIQTVKVIKSRLAAQLIDGIQYQETGEWYEMKLFEDEMKAWLDNVVPAEKSLYSHVIVDSKVESDFVKGLEARDDVILYVKLPGWFKVDTPLGGYNPDWAIVMADPKNGDQKLYLVRETKGQSQSDLDKLQYSHEKQKVKCGYAHFKEALGVSYKVVAAASELP